MIKYFYTVVTAVLFTAAAIAQPAKLAVASYKKGYAFEQQGAILEALAAYKKAIALDKKYDSAYLGLGLLYSRIKQPDSAILVFKSAIKALPKFADGYVALGNEYRYGKNNADEAIANFLKAIKLDSTNKVVFASLAWGYNTKAMYREAITYGVKALDIDNNYKTAYSELGHAYRQLKAYEEGVAQFKKNLAISVSELPLLYLAYCYMEMKQKDKALEVYEQLNKMNTRMGASLKKKLDAME